MCGIWDMFSTIVRNSLRLIFFTNNNVRACTVSQGKHNDTVGPAFNFHVKKLMPGKLEERSGQEEGVDIHLGHGEPRRIQQVPQLRPSLVLLCFVRVGFG